MNKARRLDRALQGPDYDLVLPALARLPLPLAYRLARWRGHLNAWLHRDWAELALGMSYIGQRTAQAAVEVWPDERPAAMARERYATSSREELDACLMRNGRLGELQLELGAVQALLSRHPRDRGLVVLTAHFDSFILGMLGLGLCGLTTHVMTSSVVEDPRVHPAVRNFFAAKYRAAEAHLQGGRFMHVESSARAFYRALRRNEAVVVVADAPASAEGPGLWLPWFGRERKLADGAWRLATETGSMMCALLCVHEPGPRVRWLCAPLMDPALEGEQGYARLFAFMEEVIRAYPGRWWGAHLLQDCPARD